MHVHCVKLVFARQSPLWVKSADGKVDQSLPIYPDKQTMSDPARTSHSGHEQTLRPSRPRTGRQRIRAALFTVRDRGVSFSKAKCVRVSL